MKTVDNVKRLIPFSNGAEAMQWININCDKCKYYKCHAKTVLEMGFITGDITLNRANWIGLEDNQLKNRCDKFTKTSNRSILRKNSKNIDDDNFVTGQFKMY